MVNQPQSVEVEEMEVSENGGVDLSGGEGRERGQDGGSRGPKIGHFYSG